ncbi:hypothetical protein PK35_01250 [Tamlana nanhaiensis]|uniref:YhhN-like protein n=1 Tax=Neotamlana nanhaiensis TaxID=1382798 RepID=A0A0D7W6X4_9FLAO|nr:lysoplasmalogenase family protein [Tamlana nanhaiensis]KJD34453.1 hypothetical protein PK35_01250 [Tamlana nanhaiensis]
MCFPLLGRKVFFQSVIITIAYHLLFSLSYFLLSVIDILVKTFTNLFWLRFTTKCSVIILLILYFWFKTKPAAVGKNYILLGFCFFALGGVTTLYAIDKSDFPYASIALIIVGRLLISIKMGKIIDFNLTRILLFILIYSIVTFLLFKTIYPALGDYFQIIFIWFYVSLIFIVFAYLRKGIVTKANYLTILCGIISLYVSDALVLLFFFGGFVDFQLIGIGISYHLGHYLLGIGFLEEVFIDNSNDGNPFC